MVLTQRLGMRQVCQCNEDSRVTSVQAEYSAREEEDTGSLEEVVVLEVEWSLENRLGAAAGTRHQGQARPHNGPSQLSTDLLQPAPAPARPPPHLLVPTFSPAEDTTISPLFRLTDCCWSPHRGRTRSYDEVSLQKGVDLVTAYCQTRESAAHLDSCSSAPEHQDFSRIISRQSHRTCCYVLT